jgi:glycogen debranching enzyme
MLDRSVAQVEIDVSAVAADARRVLLANRQQGVSEWGGRAYNFVCPSSRSYPFQWFWDSSFHAIALLSVDHELAKQEIRCLLQGAQPDGFIPHMLLWEKKFHAPALAEYSIVLADPFYTATVQPPVLARAVWRVYQATKDRDFLLEVLPATMRYFRWLKAGCNAWERCVAKPATRRLKLPSSSAAAVGCWARSKRSAGTSTAACSGTSTATRRPTPTR